MLVSLLSILTGCTCLLTCLAHAPLSCIVCTIYHTLTFPPLAQLFYSCESVLRTLCASTCLGLPFGLIKSLVVVHLVGKHAYTALLPSSLLGSDLNIFTHFRLTISYWNSSKSVYFSPIQCVNYVLLSFVKSCIVSIVKLYVNRFVTFCQFSVLVFPVLSDTRLNQPV